MNLTFKLALVFFLLLTLSCKERHLFSDQSELATVTRDFEDKQKALPHGDLFRIFTTSFLPLSSSKFITKYFLQNKVPGAGT